MLKRELQYGEPHHPFVFLPLRKAGVGRLAYLAYCRQLDDFVRFAGPLAWRGFPLVALDSNAPIAGLIGRYSDGFPKYFNGPTASRGHRIFGTGHVRVLAHRVTGEPRDDPIGRYDRRYSCALCNDGFG
jgi:hypothetical protein